MLITQGKPVTWGRDNGLLLTAGTVRRKEADMGEGAEFSAAQ